MNSYTPIFSKIVDSSLWHEPDYVVKVFLTMLAKKDFDNIVRGTAFNISRWACKTEAETLDALKVLAAPDTRRLEAQPFEGRRIEKVEDGWLILNGESYQKMMMAVNRRAYKTRKQAEYRERDQPLETPTEPSTPPKRFAKPTEIEVCQFSKEVGLTENDGVYFFNNWEGNGWTRSGKPIKDWKGSIRAWKAQGYAPSQKNGNVPHGTKPMSDADLIREAQS